MRLGGPVFEKDLDPQRWISAVKAKGYRAAYCPVAADAGPEVIEAFRRAAAQAGIVIAEVGAWSNPLGDDLAERQKATDFCKQQLALADAIGALCCVNISGSRGARWDGHDPRNLTPETFDMIVASVRDIIDTVQPKRTFYSLETMPWMYPDSLESYQELIHAIDRKQFAVHFDPVNLICSPQRYYSSGGIMREFIHQLGPSIKCVHIKDIRMHETWLTHLDEVLIGQGYLDYPVLLRELNQLAPDLPVMLEHLQTEAEYDQAAAAVRGIAKNIGISL